MSRSSKDSFKNGRNKYNNDVFDSKPKKKTAVKDHYKDLETFNELKEYTKNRLKTL